MARETEQKLPLQGQRILIMEDEIFIALDLESIFRDAGAEIAGPYSTLSAALDGLQHEKISAAVLDIRLGEETTEKIADMLVSRHIPFFFYSGQRLPDTLQTKLSDVQVLSKPTHQHILVQTIAQLVQQ